MYQNEQLIPHSFIPLYFIVKETLWSQTEFVECLNDDKNQQLLKSFFGSDFFLQFENPEPFRYALIKVYAKLGIFPLVVPVEVYLSSLNDELWGEFCQKEKIKLILDSFQISESQYRQYLKDFPPSPKLVSQISAHLKNFNL